MSSASCINLLKSKKGPSRPLFRLASGWLLRIADRRGWGRRVSWSGDQVHSQFAPLSEVDKHSFLKNHRAFCKERFDPEKVHLSQVQLSFFPGVALIEATLDPQTVEIEDDRGKRTLPIAERCRSYFLYNESGDDLAIKIIPLTPKGESLHLANWLLKPKINSETAIDYMKYFGLVVEGEFPATDEAGNSQVRKSNFLFVDDVDEIPFRNGVGDEERQALICALSKGIGVKTDGGYYLDLQTLQHWILGTAYRVKLPCIADQKAFSTIMTVSSSGFPRMIADEGHVVPGQPAFDQAKRPLPFYPIEPTKALKRKLVWYQRRQNALMSVFGVFMIVMSAFMLVGAGLNIAAISDVVIGAFSQSWTAWLDAFLRSHSLILSIALIGLIFSLFFQMLVTQIMLEIEALNEEWPHPAVGPMVERVVTLREQLRSKYPTARARIWTLGVRAIFLVLSFLVAWGSIFYAADALGYQIFVTPDDVSLRTSIGYTFERSLGWFFRDPTYASSGPLSGFLSTFGKVESLSGLGSALYNLMFFSIPILIYANLKQVWRMTGAPPQQSGSSS
jgi:hypothetical protein